MMKDIISCVLVLVLCTGSALSACPKGSVEYEGRCFVAGKQTVKFPYAYQYCVALGCKLAVPTQALKSKIQGFGSANSVSSNVFFAVLDSLEEGSFVEAPTGELFTETKWMDGKPTGSSSKNCIRIPSLSTWKMEDVSCTSSNNFICDCGDSE